MKQVTIIALPDRLHRDARGWAFFPFQAQVNPPPAGCDLASLHLVRTEPGAVRGNHRHPHSAEWLCLFGGTAILYWEEEGQIREAALKGADHLVYLPADTPHALVNSGPEPVYLAAFRERPGPEPQSVPHHLV